MLARIEPALLMLQSKLKEEIQHWCHQNTAFYLIKRQACISTAFEAWSWKSKDSIWRNNKKGFLFLKTAVFIGSSVSLLLLFALFSIFLTQPHALLPETGMYLPPGCAAYTPTLEMQNLPRCLALTWDMSHFYISQWWGKKSTWTERSIFRNKRTFCMLWLTCHLSARPLWSCSWVILRSLSRAHVYSSEFLMQK